MTKLTTIFSLGLMMVLLQACGGGGSSSANSPDSSMNYLSGNCGSTVVSDYNTMVLRCKYMTTNDDGAKCKGTAQSFLQKYPNINCAAAKSSDTSIDSQPTTVKQEDIQKVIDSLTAAGI